MKSKSSARSASDLGLGALRTRWLLNGLFFLLFSMAWLAPVMASAPVEETQVSSEEGEGAESQVQEREETSGLKLMVIAYIAFWAAILIYALLLTSQHRKNRQEIEALREELDELLEAHGVERGEP